MNLADVDVMPNVRASYEAEFGSAYLRRVGPMILNLMPAKAFAVMWATPEARN